MALLDRIFGAFQKKSKAVPASLFFTNTLSGKKERFMPTKPGVVTMYSCGPTVYGPQHVGNLRAAVFADTLARVLLDAGFHVRRVINITDVGHMVGDGDQGEDKMAFGAAREKKSPKEIADLYTKRYLDDIRALNIDTDHIVFPRATEYIKEQIALAKTLEEKGFAYKTSDGLYFDTAKFPSYGKLGGAVHAELEAGKRVEVGGKHRAADFALWRLAKPHDLQQWDSPWGRGNPGWHIECSAMSRALLGQDIDIHTGGEDHIAVHHNNEIAQSEAATGRPYVRYWMHNAFLTMQGEKIAKSVGNVAYLSDLAEHGLHPLALRYFFIQAHYRTPLSFSWAALEGANEALMRLWKIAKEIKTESGKRGAPSDVLDRFNASVRDDLGTSQALAMVWENVKSEEYTWNQKWALLERADHVLGLSLIEPPIENAEIAKENIPKEVEELLAKREAARAAKDFGAADALRSEIENRGYRVEDGLKGPGLTRSTQ